MKDIPIVILNRDRLTSTKNLVERLFQMSYTNITILDNGSTYSPLLKWYTDQRISKIYYNTTVNQNHIVLHNLLLIKDKFFMELLKDSWYVFTDSDIHIHDSVPDNFINDLVDIGIKYNKDKVGLGIYVNDIKRELYSNDEYADLMLFMKNYENQFITVGGPYDITLINSHTNPCLLYDAPIDTTFAVCKPNSSSIASRNCLRTDYPYLCKHLPFYYDINSIPTDELYYLHHISKTASTGFSSKVLKFI